MSDTIQPIQLKMINNSQTYRFHSNLAENVLTSPNRIYWTEANRKWSAISLLNSFGEQQTNWTIEWRLISADSVEESSYQQQTTIHS